METDGDQCRDATLRLAAEAAERVRDAEAAERSAYLLALRAGSSLCEIAAVSGRPRMTVKRMVARAETDERWHICRPGPAEVPVPDLAAAESVAVA